jgi:hypothetical protein
MGAVLSNLLAGGVGNALDGVSKVINSIRGKSPEDAAKLEELKNKYAIDLINAQLEDRKLTLEQYQQQTEVNKVEAASQSLFVAGWRPYIGWVCGSALCFQFILRPLIAWGTQLAHGTAVPPSLDMSDLFTLLFGMLGMGAMRTVDKMNGKGNGH